MQSLRPRKHQRRRLRSMLAGYRAWQAGDLAQRLAVPPRPADPVAGTECMVLTMSGAGWSHLVRLLVPADRGADRPRSDQYTVEIDGQRVADRMGLTALLDLMRTQYLPRAMTRQQRARCDGWAVSARDEADAAAAHIEMNG